MIASSTTTSPTPGDRAHRPDHQADQLVGAGPPVHGHGHHHRRLPAPDPHGPHHPELAEAPPQGGVLHGSGSGAQFAFGGGHSASLGKGPAARPGITPRPTGRLVVCKPRPISSRRADAADERRFSAAVAAVTSAFGDPTRREIYLHVRSHPGATASEVAAAFSLHPNVARHHLDRLARAGTSR